MSKLKLCSDCKYHAKEFSGHYCTKILDSYFESKKLVGNEKLYISDKHHYCSIHRSHGWFESWLFKWCGKSGRFFEPKEEKK